MSAADRLTEIEARANVATEGPWEPVDLDELINGETVTGANHGWWWVWRSAALPRYGGVLEADTDYTVEGKDGRSYHAAGAVGVANITDGESPQEAIDAEFIAAARTDVPALVAALRAVLDLADEWSAASGRESGLADRHVGYHAGARSARQHCEMRLRAAINDALREDS